MEYYYNIDNHVLVVSKVEANSMDDAIKKISRKLLWKMAKHEDLAIEIYTKKKNELSFDELKDKNMYVKVFPKYYKPNNQVMKTFTLTDEQVELLSDCLYTQMENNKRAKALISNFLLAKEIGDLNEKILELLAIIKQ